MTSKISAKARSKMPLTEVQPQTAAGKLTTRRSPQALWRSCIPTCLVSLPACLVSLVPLGITTTPALATTATTFKLPDARAWELVSPPDKDGSAIEPMEPEDGVIQAAEDGYGIAYISAGPIPGEGESAGNHAFAPTQILSKRVAGGWGTQDIQTPRNPA